MHEDRKQHEIAKTGKDDYTVSGRALAIAAGQFRRMAWRALDYLPPGEISFADYGRAIIAPDQAAYPDDKQERDWLCGEFVRRKMVSGPSALVVDRPPEDGLKRVNRQALMDSDWAAYQFANSKKGRQLLGIPNRSPPVSHRAPAARRAGVSSIARKMALDPNQKVGECLFKVWWYEEEENRIGSGYPTKRQIAVGTTMAWDRDTGKLRVILSTGNRDSKELAEQQQDRDLMLTRLADEGILQPGPQRLGPDGRPLRFAATIEATGSVMRVSNIARTLHFRQGGVNHGCVACARVQCPFRRCDPDLRARCAAGRAARAAPHPDRRGQLCGQHRGRPGHSVQTVMQDVLKELAGQPLDLYIMTHEHMDHVQGLLYYQKNVLKDQPVKDLLKVRYAWLTRSAHPDYYNPDDPTYHTKRPRKNWTWFGPFSPRQCSTSGPRRMRRPTGSGA